MSEETEFCLFPEGTVFLEPFEGHVTIMFPNEDDSIAFYQFMKAFVNGEIILEAIDKRDYDPDID